MPPTFLLYLLEVALVLLAPIVAVTCVALSFFGPWQSLSRRLLIAGVLGGCATGGLWLTLMLTYAKQGEIIWVFGAAAFGTGFSAAILAVVLWKVLRKMLSNRAPQPDAREAAHLGQPSQSRAVGRER